MSKEVAIKAKTEVALAGLEEDAGTGFENSAKHRITPFLKIMQGLSKEVKAKGSSVRAGMLLNSATSEAFDGDEGLLIVPAVTEDFYVEYVPRNEGGGFVARHKETDEIVVSAKRRAAQLNRPFGKLYTEYADDGTPTGNELVETIYLYAVLCDDTDPLGAAILAFTSTNIKFFKKWHGGPDGFRLPKADGSGKFKPALCSHLTRVTTDEHTYPGGSSYNFTLTPSNGTIKASLLAADDSRYQAAKELRDLVLKGVARGAEQEQEETSGRASGKSPF